MIIQILLQPSERTPAISGSRSGRHIFDEPLQLKVKKNANIARIKSVLLKELAQLRGFEGTRRPINLFYGGMEVNDHTMLGELVEDESSSKYFDAKFPTPRDDQPQEDINYEEIADELDALMGHSKGKGKGNGKGKKKRDQGSYVYKGHHAGKHNGDNEGGDSKGEDEDDEEDSEEEEEDDDEYGTDKSGKKSADSGIMPSPTREIRGGSTDQLFLNSSHGTSQGGPFFHNPQFPGRMLGNLYACSVSGCVFLSFFKQEGRWTGRARHIPMTFGDPQITDTMEISRRFHHTNGANNRKRSHSNRGSPEAATGTKQQQQSQQRYSHHRPKTGQPEPFNMKCDSRVYFVPEDQTWIEEQSVESEAHVSTHTVSLLPQSDGQLGVVAHGSDAPISMVMQEQGFNTLLLKGTNQYTGQVVFLETISLSPDFSSRVRTFQRFEDHTGRLVSMIVFQESKVVDKTSGAISPVSDFEYL